jgi:cysteine synthase
LATLGTALAGGGRCAAPVSYLRVLRPGYPARKRVHNLKYYTWVEQQGKTYDEIQAQWYQKDYWTGVHGQADEVDALIEEFNAKVGLL